MRLFESHCREPTRVVAKIMKGNAGQGFVTPGPLPKSSPPSMAGSPGVGGSPASAGPVNPTMPTHGASRASLYTWDVPGPLQLPPVQG